MKKVNKTGVFGMNTLQDRAGSSMNGSGTSEAVDTPLTQDRSPPVPKPWEVRAARAIGIVSNMTRGVVEVDRTIAEPYKEHIYFAYSAGRIKIGTSTNVAQRAKNLGNGSALPVTMIFTAPGSFDLEAKFHEGFAAERLHGEWFTFSPRMRLFLDEMLCRKGRYKLRRAEAAFRQWLRDTVPK